MYLRHEDPKTYQETLSFVDFCFCIGLPEL